MKQAFLQDIADKILTEHEVQSLYKVTVVLPSRRAGLFLKKYLLEKIQKPFLAPDIITINELIEKIAGFETAEKTVLLFELYRVYSNIEKEQAEPFESFAKWGDLMLTDFNEIDRYLVDAKQLFINLKNIQEIEDWSFKEDELSDSQQNFQSFWYKMGNYYDEFTHCCQTTQLFSSGMIYKMASEKIESKIDSFEDGSLYISGFNALSNSEEKIISVLCENKKGFFIVDTDAIYTENNNHEAGVFARRLLKKKWFENNPIYRHFESIPKNIAVTGVPGNTLQAAVAGQILSELSEEELNNTVLVLADEQLLLPVIHSLPDNVTAANITMGYTLKHTTVFTFIIHLFELQKNIHVDKHGNVKFYIRDVFNLLGHPEAVELAGKDTANLIDEIRQTGKSFIIAEELLPFLREEFSELKILFYYWENVRTDTFKIITEILETLHRKYSERKPLQQEFVFIALTSLHRLKFLLDKYPFVEQLKSIRNFTLQVLKKETVPFFGEPLKGLQILGMLESRALDFKNVIVLSVNESVLPQGNVTHSLIPFDLKQYFKLPTHKESDSVFAHHFYRLLQRAENISLVYNTLPDVKGAGEKSRFILQLEEEITTNYLNVKIFNKNYSFNQEKESPVKITAIPNSDLIKEKITERLNEGISPSALSTFVQCPLDFYYKYIIGIREDNYEEDIDDAKIGTITHRILQELYLPLKNKILIREDFEILRSRMYEIAPLIFKDELKNADISTGKNFLSFKVVEELVLRVLKHDEELASQNELIILDLEADLSDSLSVYPLGEEIKIKLKGIADRIDRLNGKIRIIDYKTGKVESRDVTITQQEKIASSNKALQLLIYAQLYLQINKVQEVESLIYGLRYSEGIGLPLKLFKETIITHNNLEPLTIALTEVVEELLGDQTTFKHNPKSNYCEYCD